MQRKSARILLIEEEPILSEITGFRLELLGYQVVTVASAERAQGWLAEQLPDLIIVGHVSEAEPLEFVTQLSNEQRTCDVPIIYLSANSDLDEVQKAFNAGADEYVVTPYDPLILEQKVVGVLAASAQA